MNGNVKIRIENLTKKWGKIVGIENLNLEINRGDFITLLGPSGCGKTTTLRSIAGLEEPTDGRIWLDTAFFLYCRRTLLYHFFEFVKAGAITYRNSIIS